MVTQQISSAANDVAAKQAVVDDLMRQLAVAQQKLQMARDSSTQLASQKNQLQLNITAAGSNITTLSQSLNSCSAQSTSIRQTIATLQANLTAQQTSLAQQANQNNSQSSQLSTIQSQLAQESANYNNMQGQNSSANAALLLLQSALPNATSTLASRTAAKSQADLTLQGDLASLNAAIASFKNESASLEMATMHLQNARALSQQADQAVNGMLVQRGNILPFAVAVNSTQTALIGQTVVSPSVNISNWFNYLSANFGTAAFPYQSEQVQCLYPVLLASANLRNSVACPADKEPLQTVTGKVVQVSSFNELVVAVDGTGSQETVEIPSCATLSSNVGNYKVRVGDSALVKGSPQGSNLLVAKSIVFLSQ
jgi:exonuclease VII small subunit